MSLVPAWVFRAAPTDTGLGRKERESTFMTETEFGLLGEVATPKKESKVPRPPPDEMALAKFYYPKEFPDKPPRRRRKFRIPKKKEMPKIVEDANREKYDMEVTSSRVIRSFVGPKVLDASIRPLVPHRVFKKLQEDAVKEIEERVGGPLTAREPLQSGYLKKTRASEKRADDDLDLTVVRERQIDAIQKQVQVLRSKVDAARLEKSARAVKLSEMKTKLAQMKWELDARVESEQPGLADLEVKEEKDHKLQFEIRYVKRERDIMEHIHRRTNIERDLLLGACQVRYSTLDDVRRRLSKLQAQRYRASTYPNVVSTEVNEYRKNLLVKMKDRDETLRVSLSEAEGNLVNQQSLDKLVAMYESSPRKGISSLVKRIIKETNPIKEEELVLSSSEEDDTDYWDSIENKEIEYDRTYRELCLFTGAKSLNDLVKIISKMDITGQHTIVEAQRDALESRAEKVRGEHRQWRKKLEQEKLEGGVNREFRIHYDERMEKIAEVQQNTEKFITRIERAEKFLIAVKFGLISLLERIVGVDPDAVHWSTKALDILKNKWVPDHEVPLVMMEVEEAIERVGSRGVSSSFAEISIENEVHVYRAKQMHRLLNPQPSFSAINQILGIPEARREPEKLEPTPEEAVPEKSERMAETKDGGEGAPLQDGEAPPQLSKPPPLKTPVHSKREESGVSTPDIPEDIVDEATMKEFNKFMDANTRFEPIPECINASDSDSDGDPGHTANVANMSATERLEMEIEFPTRSKAVNPRDLVLSRDQLKNISGKYERRKGRVVGKSKDEDDGHESEAETGKKGGKTKRKKDKQEEYEKFLMYMTSPRGRNYYRHFNLMSNQDKNYVENITGQTPPPTPPTPEEKKRLRRYDRLGRRKSDNNASHAAKSLADRLKSMRTETVQEEESKRKGPARKKKKPAPVASKPGVPPRPPSEGANRKPTGRSKASIKSMPATARTGSIALLTQGEAAAAAAAVPEHGDLMTDGEEGSIATASPELSAQEASRATLGELSGYGLADDPSQVILEDPVREARAARPTIESLAPEEDDADD